MPDDHVRITAPLFAAIISQLLYYPIYYSALPAFIQRIHDRETQGVAPLLVALKARPRRRETSACTPLWNAGIGLTIAIHCRMMLVRRTIRYITAYAGIGPSSGRRR